LSCSCVAVGDRLLEPVVVEPPQLPTRCERLRERVHARSVLHQREVVADGLASGAEARDVEVEAVPELDLEAVEALLPHPLRLVEDRFGDRADGRRGPVGGHLLARHPEEPGDRLIRDLADDVPERDVDRTVNAVGQVVRVAVDPAELVPEVLDPCRVLADQLRRIDRVQNVGHLVAIGHVRVLHRVTDDSFVGVERVERIGVPGRVESGRRTFGQPRLRDVVADDPRLDGCDPHQWSPSSIATRAQRALRVGPSPA
jgi:hypothetical protein